MAVKKNEVIIAELRKQFKDMDAGFLGPIKSYDDKVYNDVINFNEIGADPNVIIDNTTYPIASAQRTDDKIPISLHKLETENTIITDDELFALPYDKKSSVMQQHKEALMRAFIKLGAHSLAPQSNTTNTPILRTSGTLVGTRKRLTIADLIGLKDACDTLEIPLELRNLGLCNVHVNDLLLETDQTFRDRYYATDTGKMMKNLLSFNIFETLHAPKYNGTNATKKAFNSAAAGTDVNGSFMYSNLNAMKAIGSMGVYMSKAEDNPKTRQSEIGFRMYGIVSPVTVKGVAAIVDTYQP